MQAVTDTGSDMTMSAEKKQVVNVSRRVLVQITGSMDNFNRTGMEAATWTPINGKIGDTPDCDGDIDWWHVTITSHGRAVTSQSLMDPYVANAACSSEHHDLMAACSAALV